MKLANWIVGLCLLTASFDIVLTLNVGGTLRFTQFMMLFFMIIAFARMLQSRQILWPAGFSALSFWAICLIFFLPAAGSSPVGVEMLALLFVLAAGVFAIVQVYGKSTQIEVLMKLYLLSFVAMAILGLAQFALPLVGLPSFYVTQWVIHGRLARINGFTQEPSYYATYLLPAWIILIELRATKAWLTRGRMWRVGLGLVTLALILCTSKLGWGVMLVEVLARSGNAFVKTLRDTGGSLKYGRLSVRRIRQTTILLSMASVLLLAMMMIPALTWLLDHVKLTVFLNGTGIANTPAHSVVARLQETSDTLAVVLAHPFIGRSLGGVPLAIAASHGIEQLSSMEQAHNWWGFPVLLDLLAASGIIAIVPFLVFLYANTFGAYRLATRYLPDERAKWLRALARGMIFEWLMLVADQNLLRSYLWYHFAMIAVVAYHLVHIRALEPLPVTRRFNWRLLRTVAYPA